MPELNASCPHFVVGDLHTSLAYYIDVLGFECDAPWGDPPKFAMPRRDGFIVMLNEVDQPSHPNGADLWDAYFWCDDVEALFTEFKERGAIIEHEPVHRPLYGMMEIAVKDPDGHILAFGSDAPEPNG